MNFFKRISKKTKKIIQVFLNSVSVALNDNAILVHWAEREDSKKNFGDDLNPWLIERMTGKKIYNANKTLNIKNKPVYSCIGSILSFGAHKNLYIWGSGFISDDVSIQSIPTEVKAVRGPLTREKLISQNIYCPEIYGDPALLLPYYYKPTVKKRYQLGIVPHFADKQSPKYLNLIKNLSDDILIIDIEDTVENFVDNVLRCEKIVSSSLHGLIVADAYNIPSLHIKFSQSVIGGNFKFKDYMLSVNRDYTGPIVVNEETTIDSLLNKFYEYKIDINLKKLIESCPFPIKELNLKSHVKDTY